MVISIEDYCFLRAKHHSSCEINQDEDSKIDAITDIPRGFCTFAWSPRVSFSFLFPHRQSIYQHLFHEFVNLVYNLSTCSEPGPVLGTANLRWKLHEHHVE